MNFASLDFLLLFPLILGLYWLLPHRARWGLLLAASYFFYMRWNPWLVCLLAGTSLFTWAAARAIAAGRQPRLWLSLAFGVTLGCLGLFKYGDFFLSSASALLGGGRITLGLLLPVGISFYTFQTLSYVVDVYRGNLAAERHLGYYALYVSFFPQLVAGPIERPGNLLPQLKARHQPSAALMQWGLWQLLGGFFKKLVVADWLAGFVQPVYAAPAAADGPAVVVATVFFALQIYCDFSGYSDIARGAAALLGIRLMQNFKTPYLAASLRDFWRRWHISLTTWFTDYLYIPLGGSRCALPRCCLNLFVVFLASGLWHGASWTFVVWGGLHGLALVAERLTRGRRPTLPPALGWLFTFCFVCFGWVFFRAGSLADAFTLLGQLPTGWGSQSLAALGLGLTDWLRLPLALACLYLFDTRANRPAANRAAQALRCFAAATAIALAWLALLGQGLGNAFLYFQF